MMKSDKDDQFLPALPVEVWSAITAYATSPDSECNDDNSSPISALRCASHAFHSLLTSEAYYRARVANTMRALQRHRGTSAKPGAQFDFAKRASSAYPRAEEVGGYANLLKVIVRCAPLEGWYTISDSWPWWLLVRIKFSDGKFCGDIVSTSADPCGCRTAKRIFEICFDSNGNAQCSVAGKRAESIGVQWKEGADSDEIPLLHAGSPMTEEHPFPHHNGLSVQIGEILRDETPSARPSWSMHHPPPISALVELLLERDVPLRSNKSRYHHRYYQSELVFEFLYAIQGRPLINGIEVPVEHLVVGHNIKTF